MQGRVIKSTGSWYQVRMDDGSVLSCRIKGKLRLIDRRTTTPVNIGDLVMVSVEESDATIREVLPRRNYIIRQSTHNRTAEHIIAANIDQAFIMATIAMPRTSTGFIDRFLVTATAYHIPSIVLFNKIDLYDEKEMELVNYLKDVYSKIGFVTVCTSAEKNTGVEEVRELMKGKISLLAGHSGVGKSTLINKIDPMLDLRTAEVAVYNQKGKHTTTFAEMFELPFGGFIIDTPGIKEFGILDFEPSEVAQYFPEMEKVRHDCRFNNCMHINEPGCAVKAAVEEGVIPVSRYENYLSIMHELKTDERIYD
ncbi:MAG: ribosome small subunit-dependent GTPase A [Chitinophagaceae bacterium]|nr:ribosome small subunit-dependent GTPase A [Chitinophagaceae bacterium]